tara:strand:- start:5742 stop:5861 length:120 start_codon:yes stop_codon:yes gene_type:complete
LKKTLLSFAEEEEEKEKNTVTAVTEKILWTHCYTPVELT